MTTLQAWNDYRKDNQVFWEGLTAGLNVLYDVQSLVSNIHPESLNGSQQTILEYLFALDEEIHELARALQWKPWKDYDFEPDNDLILKEFSDILAFIGILMINIGKRTTFDPTDFPGLLAKRYEETSLENIQRLQNNRQTAHEPM